MECPIIPTLLLGRNVLWFGSHCREVLTHPNWVCFVQGQTLSAAEDCPLHRPCVHHTDTTSQKSPRNVPSLAPVPSAPAVPLGSAPFGCPGLTVLEPVFHPCRVKAPSLLHVQFWVCSAFFPLSYSSAPAEISLCF